MFHPGETVVHSFVIPVVKDDIQHVIVTYIQDDDVILERVVTSSNPTNFDLAFSPTYVEDQISHETPADKGWSKFFIQLTQQQSLLFKDSVDKYIQVNVLRKDGSRHTSRLISTRSGIQRHREVMSYV